MGNSIRRDDLSNCVIGMLSSSIVWMVFPQWLTEQVIFTQVGTASTGTRLYVYRANTLCYCFGLNGLKLSMIFWVQAFG